MHLSVLKAIPSAHVSNFHITCGDEWQTLLQGILIYITCGPILFVRKKYVKSRYNENTKHKVIPKTRISFIRISLHNLLHTCLVRIRQLDTDQFLRHLTCLTQHMLINSINSLSYETPKPFVFLSENYNVKALTLILGKATIYIK